MTNDEISKGVMIIDFLIGLIIGLTKSKIAYAQLGLSTGAWM